MKQHPTRLPACFGAFAGELDVVHRVLRRHGVGPADAEDLAQEVFLVMWRRWQDYDPQRPLRPWLLGIALRVAQDHRKRPRREVPAGLIEVAGEAPAPDQALAARRARDLVRDALGALSDKHRSLLILHDLEGVAMQEIAAVLTEPLSTLYSRLVTARGAFARAVRRMGQAQALALPPGAAEAWLAGAQQPDPPPPETRARILRRVRALLPALPGGASAPGGTVSAREPAGPPLAPLAPLDPVRVSAALAGAATAVIALALAFRVSERPASAPGPTPRAARLLDRAGSDSVRPSAPRLRAPEARHFAATLPGPFAVARDSRARLAQGLIGYWRFDDGRGSPAARDQSGHATDCQLRGLDPEADWVEGRLAGAVNLSGRGWLECPDPRFGRSADLTVAAWVKRTRAQRGLRVLATRQLGSGQRDHFFFGFDDDRLSLASHVWNGTLRHPLPGALHRWVHLAAVHQDGRVRLFVDGLRVAERRSYRGRTVTAAAPLLIGAGVNGADPAVTTQRLVGAIDELVVYDRPLEDAEIAALADGAQP